MEKIKEFLHSIGFGKNETEVYLTLIEKGDASVLDLSRMTKIHRSNIYDALRVLVTEGLVFELSTPAKLFSARPLDSLANSLHQKEMKLKELIKDYNIRKEQSPSDKLKIKVSKGNFAVREALNSMLNDNNPILVYGIPNYAPDKIGPVLKEFHQERMKRKIVMKHIYNSGAEQRVNYLNKMKYTEAKLLPAKYDSYATTNISGNRIIIFLWEEEMTVIEMIDEHLAKPYQNYFDILWSKAKAS